MWELFNDFVILTGENTSFKESLLVMRNIPSSNRNITSAYSLHVPIQEVLVTKSLLDFFCFNN